MTDFLEYLDGLANSASVEELWNLHTARMASYGFDRLIFGYTRYRTERSLGDPQDWVVLTNQSPEYMKVFIDDGMYFHAPMVRWAMENSGACSWSWIRGAAERGELNDKELEALAFNQKMGVTAGYTISFHSMSARTKGAIALTAPSGTSQDDVDAIWDEHGREIHLAANVAYLKLLTLPNTHARQLTKRQREVLEWVGDGKTTQDIAQIMGLTPATVEKHLRLARESLDVDTTAQAVLKASFYNQMFVLDF
ncbi:LuxR family transcriptional regulator [Marivivens niveibacter]|uniref:LuxR family transcriptional regulator n=1 Tax=Marivivens niveibacter TaxID=1930667 RepID=A0A251X383_9RHOB|nr:LuxR family transcriptional regulator [Marivivens niveibacter]OUD10838.1 LuxR family transcriptional regulator [Marivivens niveibacter]